MVRSLCTLFKEIKDLLHANAIARANGEWLDTIQSIVSKGFIPSEPSLWYKLIRSCKVFRAVVQRPHVIFHQRLSEQKSDKRLSHACV